MYIDYINIEFYLFFLNIYYNIYIIIVFFLNIYFFLNIFLILKF